MKTGLFRLSLLIVLGFEASFAQLRVPQVEPQEQPAALLWQEEEESPSRKSVLLAIGLSLVLPGMGELYAGDFTSGRYQLAADGTLLLTYAGFSLHAGWIRDDARMFASQHAGANFQGKEDGFDVDVGNFTTVDEYNLVRLRNREYDRVYSSADYEWKWDSEESRLRFKRLRIRSDEMIQNSRFVVGALVINRVISAFVAARAAGRSNKELVDGWRLQAQTDGGLFNSNGMRLTLTREF